MSQGSIYKVLIQFALPLMIGSIFQLLYNTTDLIFVGNFVGAEAAASVGASTLLVTCMIGIFTGLATGTSVAVSHAVGAKRKKEANDLVHSSILFAILAGVFLTIVGEILAPYLLSIMKTPQEILNSASIYIRIYMISLVPLIIYNVGSGILRACGDSTSPFYVLAVGGFINVLADALMIVGFNLDVKGAAIATSISQTFSAVMIIWLLLRGNKVVKLKKSSIKLHKEAVFKVLKLGLPAGIQSMTITLSNVMVQYYINGFGTDTITAYAYYFKLESFIYLPVLAFGQAAMTFTAQNLGAGKMHRIKKGIFVSAVISMATVVIISMGMLSIGDTALGWFGKDASVTEIGLRIIAVSFPWYWLNSLIEVFSGTIRGLGHAFLSMVIVIGVICLGRMVLLQIIVTKYQSVEALTGIYPTTWAIAAMLLFLGMLWILKRSDGSKDKIEKTE